MYSHQSMLKERVVLLIRENQMNHSLRKIQLNENKTAVAKMPCNWLNLYLLLSKQSCEVINLAPSLLYD